MSELFTLVIALWRFAAFVLLFTVEEVVLSSLLLFLPLLAQDDGCSRQKV